MTAALAEGADAEAMVRFLLELAQSKGHYQMAYPMLEAVQGHALVLVPHLEPQEARELAYWYGRPPADTAEALSGPGETRPSKRVRKNGSPAWGNRFFLVGIFREAEGVVYGGDFTV